MKKHLFGKLFIIFNLMLVVFVILFSITSFCSGWELDEYGNYRYKNEDGSYVTNARMKSGNKSVYLNNEGYIEKNFFWQNKNYAYYFTSDGSMIMNANVLIRKDTKSNISIDKDMVLNFDNMGRCKKVNGEWSNAKNSNYIESKLESSENEITRLSAESIQNRNLRIQQLNIELYLLATTSPYEGLYYSDVRKKLLEYNSYGLNKYAKYFTDSILSNSLNPNNYLFDPLDIITYTDVIIPEYMGSGKRLDEAEKRIARNFEANYECKTYGDLIYEMISKHRNLFSDEWKILISLDEKTGHYLYLGRSELTLEEYLAASQFMVEVTEFNPQKLVYSNQGYMTNFKN